MSHANGDDTQAEKVEVVEVERVATLDVGNTRNHVIDIDEDQLKLERRVT
jgi:hypothetical protein